MQKGYIVVIFSHSGTSTDCFSCLAVPTRIYLCKGDAILAMGFEQFMLFFSKFNIQYSISLKQIVSLSLQARHNNTRLFLGVHSTRVSGKEVWGPKDPNLHEFVVSTPLYRYKISGTKNIKQKKI